MKREQLASSFSSGLESSGAEWASCIGVRSCFDIAARKQKPFLLKVLPNIDSLGQDSAHSLSALSSLLGGAALVVGTHANSYPLSPDVLYSRHGISCATGETALSIIEGGGPRVEKFKRARIQLDSQALKSARQRAGLSVQRLAHICKISRATLYRYESGSIAASPKNAKSLERILGPVTLPAKPRESKQGGLFKFMHMDAVRVGSPFRIFAKASHSSFLVSGYSCMREARKKSGLYSKIAPVLRSHPFFLAQPSSPESLFGIPALRAGELSKIGSESELLSLVRARAKN